MSRKHLYQIFMLVVLFLIIVVLYLPIRYTLIYRLEEFKVGLLQDLEEKYRIDIRYRSASPTIINTIRVRDIGLETWENDSYQLDLDLEKVSFFYGLRFNRKSNLFDLRRIVLKNGKILLKLKDSSNSGAQGIDPDSVREIINDLFPQGTVELRNINFMIQFDESQAVWDISQLRLTTANEEIKLYQKGFLSLDDSLSTALRTRGTWGTDFESVNINLALDDFNSSYLLMDELNFQLSRDSKVWQLRKIKDKTPMDLSLEYKDKMVNLYFRGEGFTPSQLMSCGSAWDDYQEWLETEMNGSFSINSDLTGEVIHYESDLKLILKNTIVDNLVGGNTELIVKGSGNRSEARIEDIHINSPEFAVGYKGTLGLKEKRVTGDISLDRYTLPTGESLSSRISIDTNEDEYTITSNRTQIGGRSTGDIIMTARSLWNEKRILGSLIYDGTVADELTMDFFFNYTDGFELKSWYWLEDLNVSRALLLYGEQERANQLGSIQASSQGYLEILKKDSLLRIDDLRLNDKNFRFSLNGYANRERFYLSDIVYESGDNRIDGSLRGELGPPGEYLLRFSHNNTFYDLQAVWKDDLKEMTINGTHGIEGKASFYDTDMILFSLKTSDLPVYNGTDQILADLSLTGFYDRGDITINLGNNILTVLPGQGKLPEGELQFSGMYEADRLQLYNITWEDGYSRLNGNGDIIIKPRSPALFGGWITFLSDRGENYKIVANYDKGNLGGVVSLENFVLDRLPIEGLTGTVSAELSLNDLLNDPAGSGILEGEGENWYLRGLTEYSSEKIILSSINGVYGKNRLLGGLVQINPQNGNAVFSAGIAGELSMNEWNTGIMATLSAEDPDDLLASDYSGTIKTEEITYNGEIVAPPLTFNLKKQDEDITLYNDDRSIFNGYYDISSGQCIAVTSRILPLSFEMRGIINHDVLDFSVDDIEMDLTKLNPIMPPDRYSPEKIIEFSDGELKGNLIVSGTPENPLLNGFFTLDPLKLGTAYTAKDVGSTKAFVSIVDNVVTIPYFEVPIGNTGTLGANGDVVLSGLQLEQFNFDFFFKGRNGGSVPGIYLIGGLALNGELEGDVSFYGVGKQYYIESDMIVDRMVISLSIPEEIIPPKRNLNPLDLKVDLNFTTGRDVSMAIPNEDFYFVKATVDIGQKLNFNLDNVPFIFSMQGDLAIRRGDIAYFDKTFYLTEGNVIFAEDQTEFDPELKVQAETSVIENNEEVTIIIDYEGSLFSDFDPEFSSIPSYSEREILALMEPYQGEDASQIALALGSYVDKYTFSAPFEEGLKKALDVDLVTIETGFLKNILEDQLNTTQGVYTNDSSQYNVARYLDGTFLNMGRYLGNDLFATAGLSLDYDENSTVMGGLGFDFMLSVEMETPFFDIGWNYAPDEFDSKNSSEGFISDASITINFRL